MNKIIKYGIIGASGRLGGEVVNVFSEAGHQLVFSYDIEGESRKDEPDILIVLCLRFFPKRWLTRMNLIHR